MWAEERRQQIINALQKHQRVTADELARQFDVSRETIRRDLKDLDNEGLIRRTHGGAMLSKPQLEQPFQERVSSRTNEKRAMTAAAAGLIKPGECCFIDAGSTTASFAASLADIENISVITNSVQIAMALRELGSNIEVLLLGGSFGSDVPGTFGPATVEQIAPMRADIAFVSPVGIDAEEGASYFDLAEADVARAMLRNARRRVILADASKCGRVSRVVVCGCKDIDVLITDSEDASGFTEAGVGEVIIAQV